MSCKMEFTKDGIVLKNLNVKYLSTKTDKYDNEYAFYAILNDNIKNIATKLSDSKRLPYFLGSDNFVLKIKTRYLTEEQKSSGTAIVNMKEYEYNEYTGYYVNEIHMM